MEAADEFRWVPAQDIPKTTADLRCLAARTARGCKVGPSSKANTTKTQPAVKRRRDELDASTRDEDMTDVSADIPDLKRLKAACARNTTGVASTRVWKVAAAHRHSASLGRPKSSWDAKMKLKQERKLNQLAAQKARHAYKEAVKAKHEKKEAAKQRKIDNQRRNDEKHGVQLSARSARKMMKDKKQRKQIVIA